MMVVGDYDVRRLCYLYCYYDLLTDIFAVLIRGLLGVFRAYMYSGIRQFSFVILHSLKHIYFLSQHTQLSLIPLLALVVGTYNFELFETPFIISHFPILRIAVGLLGIGAKRPPLLKHMASGPQGMSPAGCH